MVTAGGPPFFRPPNAAFCHTLASHARNEGRAALAALSLHGSDFAAALGTLPRGEGSNYTLCAAQPFPCLALVATRALGMPASQLRPASSPTGSFNSTDGLLYSITSLCPPVAITLCSAVGRPAKTRSCAIAHSWMLSPLV